MTRVAEYDCIGGLAKGKKRFEIVEKRVRDDVDETNMNPLRLLFYGNRVGGGGHMPARIGVSVCSDTKDHFRSNFVPTLQLKWYLRVVFGISETSGWAIY